MTKILLTILCTILSVTITKAQLLKGSTVIGADIYSSSYKMSYSGIQKTQNDKISNFQFSIGSVYKENREIGVEFIYSPFYTNSISNNSGFIVETTRNYQLGVYYKYYKNLLHDLSFFAAMKINYINTSQHNEDDQGVTVLDSKITGGIFTFTPGISYRLFKRFRVELSVPNLTGLEFSKTKGHTQSQSFTGNDFSFNSSLNYTSLGYMAVGFKFIL